MSTALRVKSRFFLRQIAPDADRQVLLQLCLGPAAVEQKGASRLQPLQQVVAVDIGLLRAGDKIGPVDQVGEVTASRQSAGAKR